MKTNEIKNDVTEKPNVKDQAPGFARLPASACSDLLGKILSRKGMELFLNGFVGVVSMKWANLLPKFGFVCDHISKTRKRGKPGAKEIFKDVFELRFRIPLWFRIISSKHINKFVSKLIPVVVASYSFYPNCY